MCLCRHMSFNQKNRYQRARLDVPRRTTQGALPSGATLVLCHVEGEGNLTTMNKTISGPVEYALSLAWLSISLPLCSSRCRSAGTSHCSCAHMLHSRGDKAVGEHLQLLLQKKHGGASGDGQRVPSKRYTYKHFHKFPHTNSLFRVHAANGDLHDALSVPVRQNRVALPKNIRAD